jgi:hypothetical protein
MSSNMNSKKIVHIDSDYILSPTFPQFNEMKIESQLNLHEMSKQDCVTPGELENNNVANETADNTPTLSQCSILNNINHATPINILNLIKFVTKEVSLFPIGNIDLVTNLMYIVKDDAHHKKLATIKLVSEILPLRGETIFWKAELRFTKPEWDYFLIICNFDTLDILEQSHNVEYSSDMNVIYFDSNSNSSVEEFLCSLYANF